MTTPWTVPLQATELDLVDAAVQTLRLKQPDWMPREGLTEVMLIEALAVIAGQTSYTLAQLPATVLGQLLDLHGVPRQPGLPATGQIHVAGASSMTSDRTLPAGTRLRITQSDGTSFDLTTDAQLAIQAADPEGWVTVTCELAGARPNATPTGTTVEIVDGATWVEAVTLSQPLTGGLDEESDDAWFARGAAALRRRRSALVLPDQFADAALDIVGVGRAVAINLWDGDSGTPGEDLGHVTVVATDPDGQPLDPDLVDDLLRALQADALAALQIHAADPVYRDGTLTWSVVRTPDGDETTITDAVHTAVETYLSPSAWAFGAEPNAFRLAALIGSIPGVAVVTGCSWTWDDPAPTPIDRQLVGTITYDDEAVDEA